MNTSIEELPQNVQKSLENAIQKEGYITYRTDVQVIGGDGGTVLSKRYTVHVKGNTKDGWKETHLFIKEIINIKEMEGTLNLSAAFAAEAFVYNDLYEVFAQLQDEAGIPEQDRLKIMKSYGESNSDTTILENLTVKEYKACERNDKITLEVAEMAFAEIAKFHALSFVIKQKRPEYFKKNIKTAKSPMSFAENWQQIAFYFMKTSASHVDSASKRKLENQLPTLIAKWKDYQLDHTLAKCCLCHGDFRPSNLMMKYASGKLEDLYVVDYQLINFACPINDFLFFMFTGTDQQFRRQHLEHLKDFYYQSFSDFLKKFNLDSEDIYGKKEFDNDYKERLDYGLIIALYFLPLFLTEDKSLNEEGVAGEKPSSLTDRQLKVHEQFPERIQGIVDDFVAWGYL